MKAGAVPQLKRKWWSDNKAKTLKSTGLGVVLGQYEALRDAFLKKPSDENLRKCKDFLKNNVFQAVEKAIGMSKSPRHKETNDALKRYAGVIKTEREGLDQLFSQLTEKAESDRQEKEKLLAKAAEGANELVEKAIKDIRPLLGEAAADDAAALKLIQRIRAMDATLIQLQSKKLYKDTTGWLAKGFGKCNISSDIQKRLGEIPDALDNLEEALG